VLAVLGAAVFTPQAASTIQVLAAPERRGRAITFVFLGWSLSSVVGVPLASWIAETAGWRWAFMLVGLLSLGAAGWVWRTVPAAVRPPPLSLASWRQALSHPVLMAMVMVTALTGAGQFTLFSYFAPYIRRELAGSASAVSLLFFVFGTFGLIGNVLLSRSVDRIGAARGAHIAMALMALSLLLWPLAHDTLVAAILIVPWGLGCFASNSAQQARLAQASPVFAPALMALNTSAIYVGQAIGAGGGGLLLGAAGDFRWLSWAGLAWMLIALLISRWVSLQVPQPTMAHG